MEVTKVFFMLCFLALAVNCREFFEDDDYKEEEYDNDKNPDFSDEDFTEDLDEDDEDAAAPPPDNFGMCNRVNLPCDHCSSCRTGGWCIKNPGNKPKCLCNYGWTGPKAEWVPNTNDPAWGINRIRAENCLKPCHYTHHVRNKTCVAKTGNLDIQCHPDCGKYQGKCNKATGRCECCRGWTGPHGVYDHTHGRYVADFCNKECPFLGVGIPNPTCKKNHNDHVPTCNPKCVKSDGKCLKDGRCLCCLGWTGPHAQFVHSGHSKGKIVADYCDVYCPYTLHRHNKLCVVPDYITRRRAAGHMIYV